MFRTEEGLIALRDNINTLIINTKEKYMPTCQQCQEKFPNLIKIDGKERNCQRRKYCIKCSPFGKHNTRNFNYITEIMKPTKFCNICQEEKRSEEFYTRRNLQSLSPYCKICTNTQAIKRQRNFKEECVNYKGGKCQHCNYSKYIGALEFHHLDPTKKDFGIGGTSITKFNSDIKIELDKCILLCANCHREEHARTDGLNI